MTEQLPPTAIAARARHIRQISLRMVHAAKMGHPGGDLSAADILATLYFHVLSVNPANPSDPERDRFILSKGHASAVLYATLAEAVDEAWGYVCAGGVVALVLLVIVGILYAVFG